ncbi:MAG TPA: hypothetical protein VFR04_06755 [Solirubrobacterales bacterium]|nr:hypothetical protein [Solirubrobacterales bacterium]
MDKSKARKHVIGFTVLALVAGLFAAGASGGRTIVGNLMIDFHLDSAPHKLLRLVDTPIRFWGSARIQTKDGTTPPPLEHLMVEADRFGHLETRGLPVCTRRKLLATTAAQARGLCPGAIVGTGRGSGVVEFPEQSPIPASSPITFFNGPEIGGDPSVIVHAHLDIPAPTTYLVPIRIETIDNGIYGFRVEADVPPIAGGYGSITDFRFEFDRKWTLHGKELHYVNARCQIGHLQAFFETRFVDGTALNSHFVHPCQVR